MSGQDQRTEQPTPRRLEKARKEGNFPASREFVAAAVFTGFVWTAGAYSAEALDGARTLVRLSFTRAFETQLTIREVHRLVLALSLETLAKPAAIGCAFSILALALHLAVTRLGLAWGKARPDFSRLNPMSRLRELPSQNLSSLAQSVVVLAVFGWVLYAFAAGYGIQAPMLARTGFQAGSLAAARMLDDLLWKAAGLFVLLGLFDLARQRHRWMSRLKMSRQEIRDEHKESEGNPQIKGRIRRIQRDLLRRRMMQQVPTATAVIVNPTHYAVAIRYQPGMAAPKVVAKGKNWLALRIRDVAVRNQVPVVENAPLARALYGAADVGSEIPPHLYQAVAEVLAYIYRLMRRLPGA